MRTVRRRRVVLPQVPQRPNTVWPTQPGWSRALLALLPLGCVALGGTTERWSQGIMLLALGGVLLAMPPRASLGRGLNLVLGALALFSLTAFLPAHWFSVPVWRAALTDDFGISLPATLSPQPFLTAESLVVFAAGLSWFYVLGTVRWTDEERRRAGSIFAGGTVALAALAVACYRAGVTVPGWLSERHFGPFANRNQTADFFALAALPVMACGRSAWRSNQKWLALAWLAGWLAVALAVFHSFSRAGIFLLLATTAIYLGVEILHRTRHQATAGGLARWRRVAMVASLALVAGGGSLLFGGETLGRLRSSSPEAGANTLSNALRQSIYVDTAGMIARSPWCGTGLNTFNEIFPAYRRQAIQNPLRVRHPESDWLWLTAELGWPGLLAALVGTVLVVRKLRPPRYGHDRPLRLAAALGVAGFLIHSLVDVSAHRVGTAFAAIFLLGLALPGRSAARSNGEKSPDAPASRGLGWLFRGIGVVFLLVGSIWLASARGWLLLPGEQGVAQLAEAAHRQARVRDFAAARSSLTGALVWSPLDWRMYYTRGATGVYARRDLDETLADFRRARYLENVNAALPFDEAQLWFAAGQTAPAVNALLEACRRDPANASVSIRRLYPLAKRDPEFFDLMGTAAQRKPALVVALLEALEQPESTEFVTDVLRNDPDLGRFDQADTFRFLRLWALRADPRALPSWVAAHPTWQKLAWRWWAEGVARPGTPEAARAACEIVARFAPKPVMPVVQGVDRPPQELSIDLGKTDLEPALALRLYRAQVASGDQVGASRTLAQATARPGCPSYFFYLEAITAGEVEQWPLSWFAWQRYLYAIKANE